jgi:hypothetical protein
MLYINNNTIYGLQSTSAWSTYFNTEFTISRTEDCTRAWCYFDDFMVLNKPQLTIFKDVLALLVNLEVFDLL